MKISPVGIQSYQQLPKRDEGTNGTQQGESEFASIAIEPKNSVTGSQVAVKAKAPNYADTLSTEERRALELVFARFKDAGRFSANGKTDGEKPESGLGQFIDVKV